jgi:glucose/arabinose dehydrogenase
MPMRRLLLAVAVLGGVLPLLPVPPASAQTSPRPESFATPGDLVEFAYQSVLARPPDSGGLAHWRGRDPVQLLEALLASPEYDQWGGQVIRLYRSAYGRGPDLEGLQYWLGLRRTTSTRPFARAALGAFLASPEHDALYGGTDDREYVRRIYANAFGRDPDAAGHDYWVGQVRAVGRAGVLLAMSQSSEHRALRAAEVRVVSAYVALLGRMPDAAANAQRPVAAIWPSPELGRRLPTVPTLSVTTVLGGLSIPWGLAFAPDGTMLVSQRRGVLTVRLGDGTVRDLEADLGDVLAQSEGGLLDLALDVGFVQNRRFYTCQNRREPRDVAVVAWTVDAEWRRATRVADPLLGGIPASSGRHSGCRIVADPFNAGTLLVATGDAAIGTTPQDLTSLGGKLLRISSTTGEGVPTNPFASSPHANTRRVVEWGHRNLQGLAVHPLFGTTVSVEHGPDRDDEINRVVGGNFGWNPQPGGYNEDVPMTDVGEFPDAVRAIWSSGSPTVATSGAAWLVGCQWGAFEHHLAVATLRGAHLRIHGLGGALQDLGSLRPAALDGTQGRLRTVVQGPDGALYVTTSNGSGDEVLRVAPSGGRCGR